MPPRPKESSKPELSFEQAMERLEQIVEQMESDQVPLEDLILRYEEGVQLVQLCTARLGSAEKRIETISRAVLAKAELIPQQEPSVENDEEQGSQPAPENVSLF